MIFTSQIYDSMQNDYWVYTPAQYDPQTPAPLMVWQDGNFYNQRDSATLRVLDVIDNLVYQADIARRSEDLDHHGNLTPRNRSPNSGCA
jgi:enterochelin esterase-like enzyme